MSVCERICDERDTAVQSSEDLPAAIFCTTPGSQSATRQSVASSTHASFQSGKTCGLLRSFLSLPV